MSARSGIQWGSDPDVSNFAFFSSLLFLTSFSAVPLGPVVAVGSDLIMPRKVNDIDPGLRFPLHLRFPLYTSVGILSDSNRMTAISRYKPSHRVFGHSLGDVAIPNLASDASSPRYHVERRLPYFGLQRVTNLSQVLANKDRTAHRSSPKSPDIPR